jgi:tetratricopeptide (TPR) repeat protein
MINECNFSEAKELYLKIDKNVSRDALMDLAYSTESIVVYSFILDLIVNEESADLHYLASEIMSMPLNYITGAYNVALYHARKAIELNPEDITLKEYLLLFYNIPDKLISKKEATEIAKEVIKKIPDSKAAFELINL